MKQDDLSKGIAMPASAPVATVIITGADTPTGLTTARALRGMALDILGITSRPSTPACQARVWSRIVEIQGDANAQLDRLIELAERGELPIQAILFFSQDTHVIEASKRLEKLRRYFNVPLPTADVVERLMDKTLFHAWASDKGFAVPVSVIVREPREAMDALGSLRLPCILKPLVRTPEWDASHSNRKFFTIGSKPELETVLASETPFALAERFVLQEWIKGTDEDVFFVLFSVAPEGQILSIQGGRKIWQWPPLGGSTALCRSCDSVDLIEKAKAVVLASGLTGLASVEFKRDAASGQFLITEPTVGRNDYQSGLANVSPRNPTRLLVEHLLGKPAPDRPSINPKRALWIDEVSCLRRIRSEAPLRSAARLARALLRGGRIALLWGAWADLRPLRMSLASLSWRRKK